MRLEDWFDSAAHTHRNAPALIEGDRSWTFGEVDALATNWAVRVDRATDSGMGPVAVLAGRSAVGYIGALAALRTGAALVPLNPSFPAIRNAAVLAATGTAAAIVDAETAPDLVEEIRRLHDVTVVRADAEEQRCAPPAGPSRGGARPSDTAYVLFTSGSTGKPKGVPVSHANVSAFLSAATRRYPLTSRDRLVQAYDMTFDLGLASLFLAWSQGCPIVPASLFALANPAKFVTRHDITVWASVPSVIELAGAAGHLTPGCLPTLRLSMFCGEALTTDAALKWAMAAPCSRIENTYGPTELTMFCTAHTWRPEDADAYGPTVPIGVPFDGIETRVVDTTGHSTETGELLLRGAQMFDGYLDSSNDARVFTSDEEAGRWYRTGDLVTNGPFGLTHLGRIDDQLQVGGYRVEPAEVERIIRTTLGVDLAVVVKHGKALVAFVTPKPADERPLISLTAALPPYMCPKRIVVVDDVRRNGNGKIDRGHYRLRAAALA
ncbi:AMP-binding protein [Streptomyces sp. NBC_00631]|uniref:AMP-binding protein n=1 Tax=Streptomyces sp. NBC_00631 TaxID=2975793 RepID=UPI0030E5A598